MKKATKKKKITAFSYSEQNVKIILGISISAQFYLSIMATVSVDSSEGTKVTTYYIDQPNSKICGTTPQA